MSFQKYISKMLFTIMAIIVSVTLSSCLDITQTVSLSDGRYAVSVKCGFDRNQLYLADADEDSLNEELDRFEAGIRNEQFNITFNRIDTGNEIGFFLKFDCSSDADVTSDLSYFLPYSDRRGLKFPLLIGEEISQTEIDDPLDLAVTVMSVAKYRMFIDKNVINRINSASVIDSEGRHSTAVSFYDCGTSYLIEIPISMMYGSKWTYTDLLVK